MKIQSSERTDADLINPGYATYHVTSIPVKVEAFCGEKSIAYEITCMHTLPSERLHIIVARQHRLE
jgi:hypothetical protein